MIDIYDYRTIQYDDFARRLVEIYSKVEGNNQQVSACMYGTNQPQFECYAHVAYA